MRLVRSPLGAGLLLLGLAVLAVVTATLVQVHRVTTGARAASDPVDFASVHLAVEEVVFPASDGVELRGWWMDAGMPAQPVVLCHDAGTSKASLVNLAIELARSGFGVLLFDFRGHGESAAARSTLGLTEKRDIFGALDFLAAIDDREGERIGIYGVGMGAHAAVLAASERPQVKVLVLDGLYPDVAWEVRRRAFPRWAADRFAFLSQSVFTLLSGADPSRERAADLIGGLPGRDLLLLAPAGDPFLTAAMQSMVRAIPDQVDADGNLVILPATQGSGLYGEQFERYQERVAAFFHSRLARPEALVVGRGRAKPTG